MSNIPKTAWEPMHVTFEVDPHITDPTLAGRKSSIYSTPYNRAVADLASFIIETARLIDHLRLTKDDEIYKQRFYYIACRAVELWPWMHDENMVSVIEAAIFKVHMHYATPLQKLRYSLFGVPKSKTMIGIF